jgi:hypothetical protein
MRFTLGLIVLSVSLPAFAQDLAPADPAPPYAAMTSSQRWNDFVSGSLFSPSVGLRVFGSAAISHFNHEPLEWGMGSRGYFERAGSHYARFAVQGGIHSGLAAALGHDTRYYREPDKSGWRRARHALRRTFLTRDRAGRSVFDVSEIASLYAAPALASTWHPRRMSPEMQALRGGSVGIGMQAAGNLFREFGPDLKRRLLRK